MKKVLILAVAIVMCASLAFAQTGGHIGLYSDEPGYSDCFLQEALFVNNYIYVVHVLAPEANTSQWMVTHNWTAISGAVTYYSNLNLGDVYTGVTVTYVGCKPLPHALATLAFIPTWDEIVGVRPAKANAAPNPPKPETLTPKASAVDSASERESRLISLTTMISASSSLV